MKTLIIYNHPHEGSFCNAILKAAEKGLQNSGQEYITINLDKDGFDPVMRGKDLQAFARAGKEGAAGLGGVDPLVMEYKKHLEWAEHLAMIFPIWWMTTPAMMKGFIDKVIFPAIAYDMDKGRLVSRLHNLQRVTVISTMNTPADIYKERFGNALENTLIKGTFNQIGITNTEWLSLNMVKQTTDRQRGIWLEAVETLFEAEQ